LDINDHQVLIDLETVAEGTLEDDWDILPPKKIKASRGRVCVCVSVCGEGEALAEAGIPGPPPAIGSPSRGRDCGLNRKRAWGRVQVGAGQLAGGQVAGYSAL
jgi:hypothetical protein